MSNPKDPKLTERNYGKHRWITLDEGQGPSELEQAQKADKQKKRLFESRKAYRQRHKDKLKKYHERWRDRQQPWKSVLRNAWNALNKEAKKKRIDGMPWEIYWALWEAAGDIRPPWSDTPVPAYTLRAKYFDERFRCMIAREDMELGWKPGNVKIIAVEGPYRQWMRPAPGVRSVMGNHNTEIRELSRWDDNGTEDGEIVSLRNRSAGD